MKRFFSALAMSFAAGLANAVPAEAAQFTIPSFTLFGPASTGTVCTPTAAASGPATSAPAGTVVFACVVSPATWIGGVSIVAPNLAVTGLSGNTFNLVLNAAGIAQTYPAASGSTTP